MTGAKPHPDLLQWAARLRRAAALAWAAWPDLSRPPEELVATFRDDAGHRRAVDEHFLRAAYDLPPAPPPEHASPDVLAWRLAAGGAGLDVALPFPSPVSGPLVPPEGQPIEIWTETELSTLHALWRVARLGGDASLRNRCLDAAAWHLEHTQSDNATNHPWGLHVFLELAAQRGGHDQEGGAALFHAEQLLHNSLIALGRPDRLSAHILRDAAAELDLGGSTRRAGA